VVLFVAGHGINEGPNYRLATNAAQKAQQEPQYSKGGTPRTTSWRVQSSPRQNVLDRTDTCTGRP
jgi:hypothetical protein